MWWARSARHRGDMSSYQPYPGPSPTGRPEPVPCRRLTRSSRDQVLGGVCGGIAEYARIDANLLRIAVVAAVILGFGTPILVYLAAWLLIPAD